MAQGLLGRICTLNSAILGNYRDLNFWNRKPDFFGCLIYVELRDIAHPAFLIPMLEAESEVAENQPYRNLPICSRQAAKDAMIPPGTALTKDELLNLQTPRSKADSARDGWKFMWPGVVGRGAFHYVKHRNARLPDTARTDCTRDMGRGFHTFTPVYGMHFTLRRFGVADDAGPILLAAADGERFLQTPLT